MTEIKKVAVIGSGTMGNGIAHVFAQHDFEVALVDISPEAVTRALSTIEKNLTRQVEKGTITPEVKTKALQNITTHTLLKEGVKGADLVVEAATENTELKLSIFKELDTLAADHTILASNTSSISITKIAAHTSRPRLV